MSDELTVGGSSGPGVVRLRNASGRDVLKIWATEDDVDVQLCDGEERPIVRLLSRRGGLLVIADEVGHEIATLNRASVRLGAMQAPGLVEVRDESGTTSISLVGRDSRLVLGSSDGEGVLDLRSANGGDSLKVWGGTDGCDMQLFNQTGEMTIRLLGGRGDIELLNGDIAERFQLDDGARLHEGAVAVLTDGGLRPCDQHGDSRVVGVVAGAGDRRPGVLLNRGPHNAPHVPIALAGTVNCLVQTGQDALPAGSLLTTAARSGYAEALQAGEAPTGRLIGKTLTSIPPRSSGLHPIVVCLG